LPVFHVWFATRSRKWLLQGEIAGEAKRLLIEVANMRGLKLLECEAVVDHVHLLLECEDRKALSKAMFYLKGGSSHELGLLYPSIKLDAHTLHIWQKGYGSKIVAPPALDATREYIRTQWDRLEEYDRPNPFKA
jgi:putative transposase